MKADGNPSLSSFLLLLFPGHHLLLLIHACCFLFLPLCSPALCHPFWSLWESCGFQRVRKGQPYCPRGQAAGLTHVTTCHRCSVSTPLVWLYSHLIISPPVACTLFPLAHTPKCDWANAHTRGSSPAHIHIYRSMRTTTEGPLPSNNHHTEQIKESRC